MTIDEQIVNWFEYFHANPEISWEEHETTKKIASILDELSISYKLLGDVPGLLAEIGEGEDVVAVRADIDALWQEVDGEWRANHSCGHDANISMVLGALLHLKEQKQKLNHRVRFIFQPAEEKGNGAVATFERGAVEDVTHLFGVHLRPIEELKIGQVSPAIHHGAAVFLEGSIHGTDAHGARPHQGQNAIDVVVAIQQMVKNIYISPFEPNSVKLTKIVADGGSINIIPGSANFTMDVRAQKNVVLKDMQSKVEHGLEAIKQQFNVDITWNWVDLTPGAEVSSEAAKMAEEAIVEVLGKEYLTPPVVTPGSDDFHFYTVLKPELKATMIGIGANLAPGLHHPKMTFEKEALLDAAKVLSKLLSKTLVK
ncbi:MULTISPECIES: amidohydrolase [unclassified Viridibacillus]|uniref:amidohydrolase n=1 Tax=unclassified Viridibacillus TaxID=2617942 RepID=UPI000970032F|nr:MULTISPECIES: amidohydrolase [unclassified Viridibacillus]OMC82467.1 amidohydrolase [Viridibacillus sp. FSL H8-0123]OMC87785.1 amidohydrolase [Viridibacillus sp. FSL H7-0596]